MHTFHVDVQAIAAQNEGLIRTRDLVELGLSDAAIRSVTRRLRRICWGAYVLSAPANEEERHRLVARATIQRYRTTVALSHITAAVTHGLPVSGADLARVQLTGTSPIHVRRGDRHRIRTHCHPLPDTDVVDLSGIAVTSVPRTVVDCALALPVTRGLVIADHALHHRLATLDDIRSRVAALGPLEGIRSARTVGELADGLAESPGETRTRLILVNAGIRYQPQAVIEDRRGRFVARVDFLLPEFDVVLEFDGRGKYELTGDVAQAHWDEKLRQNAIEAAGFTVVRIVWADLASPTGVIAKVQAAAHRHRRRRAG